MERIPEPELMDEVDQSIAYAEADFADTDQAFVQRFIDLFGNDFQEHILDLGCGPGNITFRIARVYPDSKVTGIDGSEAMLDIARERMTLEEYPASNVLFVQGLVSPQLELSCEAIVSNSLLHHLHDPSVLWESVKSFAQAGSPVLIRDLRRPDSREHAQWMVDTYAADAPEVLKADFYNSLLAAFTTGEVEQQLAEAGLDALVVSPIGDRHLEIQGRL